MARSTWIAGAVAVIVLAAAALVLRRGEPPAPREPATAPATEPRPAVRAAAPAPQPKVEPGSVHGTVLRADGSIPESGRTVSLLRDGEPSRTTAADPWGRFAFDAVAPGAPHEVRVEAEGCATVRVPGIVLVPGESRDVGDLLLGPPREVRVFVTDEAGAPLAGAAVEVLRNPSGALADFIDVASAVPPVPIDAALTEATGRVTFRVPAQDAYSVAARAPRRARVVASQRWTYGSEPIDIALALPPGESLAGRVTNADGRPVPSAAVLASLLPPIVDTHHGTREWSAALWQRTVADRDGRFAFDSLSPGETVLVAGPAGRPLAVVDSVAVPAIREVDLVLPTTAAVAGRVADARGGSPVAGAVVAAKSNFVSVTTTTGTDGRYRLDGLAVGREVSITLLPPAGWTGRTRFGMEDLRAGEARTLDMALRRAATVAGRVLIAGAPAAGADVRVSTLDQASGRLASTAEGRTDSDGRYRIEDVLPGSVVVFAAPPGSDSYAAYSAWRRFTDALSEDTALRERSAFDVAAGAVTSKDLAAEPAPPGESDDERVERQAREMSAGSRVVRVRGRVTTADGLPLLRPQLVADGDDFGNPWALDFARPIPQDGTFDAPCRLRDGRTVLSVFALDERHGIGSAEAVEVPPGVASVHVDVVLPALPTMRGRVVSGGTPVAGALVYRSGALVARSGPDGTFAAQLPIRSWSFGVAARGYVRRSFEKEFGREEGVAEFAIESAAVIEGRVVDGSGRPVAGTIVAPVDDKGEVLAPYGHCSWGPSPPVPPATDAEGRFRLDEVPPGSWRLRVESPYHATGKIAGFTSEPIAAGTRDVRLVVKAALQIAGRVLGPDGKPLYDVRVRCTPGKLAEEAGAREAKSGTHVDGRFAFDGLPGGGFVLEFQPSYDTEVVPLRREVESGATDVEVRLDAAAVVAGVVVKPDGNPIQRTQIEVERLDTPDAGAPKWPWGFDDWTDEKTGAFRMRVPPGSRFRVRFGRNHPDEYAVLLGGEDVAAGTSDLRLVAAPGVGVSGEVVDETGRALAAAAIEVRAAPGNQVLRVRTDVAGRFAITGLEPGTESMDFVVRAEGRVPVQRRDLAIGTADLRIVLRPGRTISGRLLDADGKPARRWHVRALRASPPGEDLWRATVDERGGFTIQGLEDGEWALDAIVEGCMTIEKSVPLGSRRAGESGLELRLPR